MVMGNKKYFAFISYKREDEEWAKWFQNELENYHLPSTLNGRTDISDILEEIPEAFRPPKNDFRPVFRDIDELKAGNLPEQIYNALQDSLNLVVICSPKSAKSEWVNKEIHDFIDIGRKEGVDNIKNIFPFIVDGIPHAGDEKECFPKLLRELSSEQERIGGNVNEGGNVGDENRERAFVKVLAGMLPESVSFDMLWDRYDRDKKAREVREKEQRDNLLIAQSRFLAEKANQLVEDGDSYLARLLALEALPKNIEHPDRPYVHQVESVLRNACYKNCMILRGHQDYINTIAFSPDGKYLVSGSNDKRVIMWNTNTGENMTFVKGYYVQTLAYHPNGRSIALAVSDKILIYDIVTKKLVRTLKGHTWSINSLSFSYDGIYLASSSGSYKDSPRIWDIESGRVVFTLTRQSFLVNTISFSPDGSNIVIACGDGKVRIYNVMSRKLIRTLRGHTGNVSCANYCPDGTRLVTSSWDSTVRVWDTTSGNQLYSLKDHTGWVLSVAFSSDGGKIVSASRDGTIKLWEGDTGKLIQTVNGHTLAVFSPDNKLIAFLSPHYSIRIIDIGYGQIIYSNNDSSKSKKLTVIHSNNNLIATEFNSDNAIKIFNSLNGQLVSTLKGLQKYVTSAIYNGYGELLHDIDITSLLFSEKGDTIISVSCDKTIVLWDIASGERIKAFKRCPDGIKAVSYSPQGRYVASAYGDSLLMEKTKIKIWDCSTGRVIHTMQGHNSMINSISFSPDEKYIVTASGDYDSIKSDNTIRIWRTDTGKLIRTIKGHDKAVRCICFSPDGTNVVSASDDNSIKIWDVTTGNMIQTIIINNSSYINSVNYSSDAQYIISAHEDGTVNVFDFNSSVKMLCVQEDKNIPYACFSPDGHNIIYVSYDGVVRSIDFLPLQQLIDKTRERFENNQLTLEERKIYYLE